MLSRDVLILGAGFSRALNSSMPDLNALKDRVLEITRLDDEPEIAALAFGPHYTFEDWLSTLGEYQPYLSEQKNLSNAALFALVRDAIASVLTECEADTAANVLPRWLDSLVRLLHHRHATIITLNYDRLVEIALCRAGLRDLTIDDERRVDDRSALLDIPPTKLLSATDGDLRGWTLSQTLRLLKLHGSLDWWMSPRDATGSTLVREELRFGVDGVPISFPPDDHSRVLTGRELALVPPVLTKSTYFTNIVTRQLWEDANKALSKADHVAIVGYSLPPGDSMMSGLLVSTLRREEVAITIVNKEPGDLTERVGHLTSGHMEELSGDTCVAEFVASYIDRVDDEFRAEFQRSYSLRDPLPLVVSTGSGDHTNLLYGVTSIDRVGDRIVLRTVPRGNVMQNAVRNDSFGIPRELPTSQDLAVALGGVSQVVIDLDGIPEGLCRPVRARFGFPAPVGEPVATLLLVVPDPNPSRLT